MFKIFQKKPTKSSFSFAGNRPHIRVENELAGINKEEADNAFKQCKKEFIDTLLLSHGFCKYKTRAYVRISPIGLLEYIDLQKEHYGSRTFCVNFSAMPLYWPHEVLVFTFGHRLGNYICDKDIWWDYASEQVARLSFQNVAEAMEQYILPWFEAISTEEGYREKLSGYWNKRFAAEWLDALENTVDKETLISQSILTHELPKKIQRRSLD